MSNDAPVNKKIAIVAVHGVGNHEPRASARALSRLLMSIPRRFASRYTSFKEEDLAIPTRRVPEMADAPEPLAHKPSWTHFHERPSPGRGSAPLDMEFMEGLLEKYSADTNDGFYDTVRLEGHRLDESGKTVEADVHIYEMFWSDISRIGKSLFGIFGAFYQLVIHLPYVGGWTLQQISDEAGDARSWRMLRGVYASAQRSLTLIAPTLNMIMLAVGLSLLTRHIPTASREIAARAGLGILSLAVGIVALSRSEEKRRGHWIFILLALGGLPLAIPAGVFPRADWALIVEWWLIVAVPLWAIFSAFQRNRPFALPLGIIIFVASTVALAFFGLRDGNDPAIAVLRVLELLASVLQVTWLVFGASLFGVLVLGEFLSRLVAGAEFQSRARRAVYTARFALALPSVSFAVATLSIWGLLVAAEGETTLGRVEYSPLLRYPSLEAHQTYKDATVRVHLERIEASAAADSDKARARETLKQEHSATYFLRSFWLVSDTLVGVAATLLVVIALFLAAAVMAPAVVTESKSPRSPPDAQSRGSFSAKSKRLGLWLSFAFRGSRLSGELLVVACLVSFSGLVIFNPWTFTADPSLLAPLRDALSYDIGISSGSFSPMLLGGAGTLGIIAVLSTLSRVGSGLRPVLGVAVDVSNYLRELPADRTPRARMAERMTSLFRYLNEWRAASDDARSGYDAVIIVAHSQGTMITADLLRYLRHIVDQPRGAKCEPKLSRMAGTSTTAEPLPIFLFTMGNPLRQLYALRFPNLYSWVGFDEKAGPRVEDLLGVKKWVNAYRSGDYVGRSVLRDDDQDPMTYAPFVKADDDGMTEWCIGPGAHTHYWDESADSIAMTIDALVGRVIAPGDSSEGSLVGGEPDSFDAGDNGLAGGEPVVLTIGP